MTQQTDWRKQWAGIVAQAWTDEKFKQHVLADPAGALKDRGLHVPAGVQVKVVQDTDNIIHLTLPTKPSSEELADEMLARAAGGYAVIKELS